MHLAARRRNTGVSIGGTASSYIVIATIALACVESSFPEGLPCGAEDPACPPGQTCFTLGGGSQQCYIPFVCNLVDNDCPAGLSCYWSDGQGPTCMSRGNTPRHDTCTIRNECGEDHGCHNLSCERYCLTAAQSPCAPSQACVALEQQQILGICVFQGCHPLDNTACMPGYECFYDDQTTNTMCERPGTLQQGQSCTGAMDCVTGLHCFDCGGTTRVCSEYCDMANGNSDCTGLPNAETCTQLDGAIAACSPCP